MTPWTCPGWEKYDDDNFTAQTTESDYVENSATLVTLGESSSTSLLVNVQESKRPCGNNYRDDEEKEETNSSTVNTQHGRSSALRPALRINTQDNNDVSNNCYNVRPHCVNKKTSSKMIRNSSRNHSSSSNYSSSSNKQRAMDSSSNQRSKVSSSRSQRHHHSRRHHHKQHAGSNNRKYTVQFDPLVMVISIPSHRDYTPQERAALHCTEIETLTLIERNTNEFTYEGWDWKCVIEEEAMIFDSKVVR